MVRKSQQLFSGAILILVLAWCNDKHSANGLVSSGAYKSKSAFERGVVGKRYRRQQSKMISRQAQSQNEESSSPRVKFTGSGDSTSFLDNPLDRFLSLIASDTFSIAFGMIGLLAAVVHRWGLVLAMDGDPSAAEALTYQTRTDLLAVFASGSVLLNGVTKLDVTTALAESVVLEGTSLSEPEDLSESKDGYTSWALSSLLSATPAKSAVLIDADDRNQWKIQCRAGIVPPSSSIPERAPILDRVGSPGNEKETYLPTLQALPGRTELTYLPSNTQMAVMIPIQSESPSTKNKVLVLGGNTAKSFTPRDIAWSRIVAERIGDQS